VSLAAAAPTQEKVAGGDDDGVGPLSKVWSILSRGERRQLLLLTPAVVLMAVLETAGVASIVPFLGLLSDPATIERNEWLSRAYELGGFMSRNGFFFAVGLSVLALVTVGNVVSALTTWALLRFSWLRNHTLSTRLLDAYLHQPYEFFLSKNSSELGKNILTEVQSVVTGVIVQGVQLTARFVVVVAVSVTLFILDPFMAAGVLLVFGGVYGALFLSIRRRVTRAGRERVELNRQRFKVAQEALAGIKELKLYGLEPVALQAFSSSSHEFATRQASNAVVAQMPRFALETIAFGGVLVMVSWLLAEGRPLEHVLPVLGLYAFAAYRMLPALQTIFGGLTQLRFNVGALDVLHADLITRSSSTSANAVADDVPFARGLSLRSVSFRYQGAGRQTLDGVDLDIAAGDWVALVGPTGAGKSTIVDVVLGLLQPHSGSVDVDGVALDSVGRRLGWQRHTAYVPQQIFLVDDSVARNIAFGLPAAGVDQERVEAAARVAQIHEFITTEMPAGYATAIGERGVRLSGGQRQRIGIARALYRRPRLLVLDEATSALDNGTEEAFFAALHEHFADCAVVSVAHRLSTTKGFDRICVVERGRIVDSGAYAELERRSPHFRQVGGVA
jgi:ABC-type multidrug transport system fused ATPase/permease subunit